ncbi:MAG: hypothetical protein ACLPT6_09105 [Desulfobaccales bacterium]
MKSRTGLIVTLMALSLIMGCASGSYLGPGALLGGGLGAIAGAAIDHGNPWQGALIGGLAGSALGAAGGYALQQGQTGQPQPGQPQQGQEQQGYNYPAQPGSGAAAPPGYGYGAPAPGYAPGPAYGDNRGYPAAPQGPQEIAPPPPESYNQAPPPQTQGIPAAPPGYGYGYGYGAPAPGAAPASAYSNTWTSMEPQGPQGNAAPPPESYSQAPLPRDPGIRAPLTNGPYYPEE